MVLKYYTYLAGTQTASLWPRSDRRRTPDKTGSYCHIQGPRLSQAMPPHPVERAPTDQLHIYRPLVRGSPESHAFKSVDPIFHKNCFYCEDEWYADDLKVNLLKNWYEEKILGKIHKYFWNWKQSLGLREK